MSQQKPNKWNYKWIKFCKLCGADYMPARGSWEASTNLCTLHRNLWYKEKYKRHPWSKFNDREKKMWYRDWLKWVKKNWEHRNAIALRSYHRRKNDPEKIARRRQKNKKLIQLKTKYKKNKNN
jgi:hypothetical protein